MNALSIWFPSPALLLKREQLQVREMTRHYSGKVKAPYFKHCELCDRNPNYKYGTYALSYDMEKVKLWHLVHLRVVHPGKFGPRRTTNSPKGSR